MCNKRVGIMGGTFDPIHYGHLILAEHVSSEMNLDKILFMPSGTPHLKSGKRVSEKKHRLAMTKLGIMNNQKFSISTIEMDRRGNTYTVETIEELTKECPLTTFYFIIGADSLFDLLRWKNYQKLFEICNFVVSNRGGTYTAQQLNDRIDMLMNEYKANITPVHIPDIQISSSIIRKRVNDSLSIKYLLPDKVQEYIDINKLYSDIVTIDYL